MVLTGVQIAPPGQPAGIVGETVTPAGKTELSTKARNLYRRRGPMAPVQEARC